jgi:hypothetical protein
LSIVIPVLGELKRLEDTLASVLANRPADCQIVVVHNRPYDDPYDLKGEVDFVEVAPGSGWVASIRAGMEASRAPIVNLLACGVEVDPDWTDAAMPHFLDAETAAVAALVLDRGCPRRALSAGLRYRPSGTIRRIGRRTVADKIAIRPQDYLLSGPDSLCAFYRKSSLEAIGGISDRAGDSFAAVATALALNQAGFRWVYEPKCQAFAGREVLAGRSAFREGRDAERLFWLSGMPRPSGVLLTHIAVLVGEMLLCAIRPANVCRLVGRMLGAAQASMYRAPTPAAIQRTAAPRPQTLRGPHYAHLASTRCSVSLASSSSSSPSSSSSACSKGPAAPRRLPG